MAPHDSNVVTGPIYYICKSVSCDQKVLPVGHRNVGQGSNWKDESGRFLAFNLFKLDTNTDAISFFVSEIERCKVQKDAFKKTVLDYDCGSAGVGEYSYYEYEVKKDQPDVGRIVFQFIHNNNNIYFQYSDEREKTKCEAVRIAKIVEGRLG